MRLRIFATLMVAALMTGGSAIVAATRLQQKAKAETDPISGEWDVSLAIAGMTAPAIFKLKLDGDKVTGTAESQHTGPGTVSNGSWIDGKLKFTLSFAAHESIALTGALKDGYLVGEFATEGMLGKWKAKKKDATAAKSEQAAKGAVSSSADPISGEWDASLEAQGMAAPVTFKLKLDGDKVTGTTESPHLGQGTVSNGSWIDGKLRFTIEGNKGAIAITGILKEGKLVGEFDAGRGMQGKWQAIKK